MTILQGLATLSGVAISAYLLYALFRPEQF
ncbi:potassium-transporting ATPase subunit F [Pokkaliibacter sp. MBI-7]|nr:potassium-transporting ATPase subunit F [Pokkaliibacter sp. MBI-7]MDH2435454.1 potassium-transporting ATPase subunit F [Pokkaliibacter sp. MBI-7]